MDGLRLPPFSDPERWPSRWKPCLGCLGCPGCLSHLWPGNLTQCFRVTLICLWNYLFTHLSHLFMYTCIYTNVKCVVYMVQINNMHFRTSPTISLDATLHRILPHQLPSPFMVTHLTHAIAAGLLSWPHWQGTATGLLEQMLLRKCIFM